MNDIIKNLSPDMIVLIACLGTIIILAVVAAVSCAVIYLIGELAGRHEPQRIPEGPWSR